jgi:nitrate reductase assembly molybdenum cofactor insertion protein NarJ
LNRPRRTRATQRDDPDRVSELLSDFHAFLDEYDFDQAEAQLDYMLYLQHLGVHMTDAELSEFDECGRAVHRGRNTYAKYGTPKAPAQRVSDLLSDFRVFLNKNDVDEAEAQRDQILRLLQRGIITMSKRKRVGFDACGRAVAMKRHTLAEYAPPKAPEMTVLSVDYQEPPPADAPYGRRAAYAPALWRSRLKGATLAPLSPLSIFGKEPWA